MNEKTQDKNRKRTLAVKTSTYTTEKKEETEKRSLGSFKPLQSATETIESVEDSHFYLETVLEPRKGPAGDTVKMLDDFDV